MPSPGLLGSGTAPRAARDRESDLRDGDVNVKSRRGGLDWPDVIIHRARGDGQRGIDRNVAPHLTSGLSEPGDRAKTVQKVHLLVHQRSVIRAKADSLKPHKLK